MPSPSNHQACASGDSAKVLPVSARGLLWLGVGLSVFYLLLVAVTILAQPFLQDVSPIELMHFDGLTWEQVDVDVTEGETVWGTSSTDVWLTTRENRVLRFER